MLLFLSTFNVLALLILTKPYQVYNAVLTGKMRLTLLEAMVKERQGWGSASGGLTPLCTFISSLAIQPLQ